MSDYDDSKRARRLDSDWLAVDEAGHVALFAANEWGMIPTVAETGRVSEALEALARALGMRRATAVEIEAYRGFADRAQEPIFDVPRSGRDRAAHEAPISGYPLLVAGTDPRVRELTSEWEPREAVVREGFALVFPVIGQMTYDDLHERGLCLGCRVLDEPADPRPRAPEALAAAGVYSYAHSSEMAGDSYCRVASPTVAAERVDLEPIAAQLAGLVRLPLRFENERSLDPAIYMECAK